MRRQEIQMLTFRKILFPVDLSPRCVAIAPYAAAIAHKFKAELILLHAVVMYEDLPYDSFLPPNVYAAYEDAIRKQRAADLENLGCKEFEGLTVTRLVEVGLAADRIVQYAGEHGIDLIVMPTHGYGRFRRLLLGSVTSKVLHDAACPVWTTVHSEELAEPSSQNIRNIVCAVDIGSDEIRVIRAARDMASQYGATVCLVHAVPYPDFGPGATDDRSFQRFLFDTAKERMTALQQEAQSGLQTSIDYGRVAAVIRDTALRCDAQLVVIGRGRIQEKLGRIRTNVHAIIRESPCPVLSV
jgi:nucleotide-binding universal stress UspA family protein